MISALDRTDIERFRAIVIQRFGLQYDDGRLDYLENVLYRRMETTRIPRFDRYVEYVTALPSGSEELQALAEQLTVTETFFFRNADHFRACADVVLPECIRAKNATKRLRILSAGCASGEEPYSLAVLVREALPDLESWDVKIHGVDINPRMLQKAKQARYSTWSLRATSERAKRRYFREDGRDFVLDPVIQKMVSFEERNLVVHDLPFWQSLGCDIIFCRNVIMYFTPQVMREVVHRISQALLPSGFLFLGHAETLRGLSEEFHLCHTNDTFYYQRRNTSALGIASVMPERRQVRVAATLPAVVETTTSWIDAIQRASEHIATLANNRALHRTRDVSRTSVSPIEVSHREASHTIDVAPPAAHSWDLSRILETMRQERFSDALELLCELPPGSQDEPDALLLRAILLTNSGKREEAERVCTRLLALDELNAGAHYVIALCREYAGDAAGAIEYDQTAVYLDADFAMPHLHLGLMAKRTHDSATARRELEQALTLFVREDVSRLLLFGGGFSRETLLQLCRTELRAMEILDERNIIDRRYRSRVPPGI